MRIVLIIVCLLVSHNSVSNFGGYISNDISESGNIVLKKTTAPISLDKERLFFDVGQRVKVKGHFWLTNNDDVPHNVTIAFPQDTRWKADWDSDADRYVAQDYKVFRPNLEINDVAETFNGFKYSKGAYDLNLVNRKTAAKWVEEHVALNEANPVYTATVWLTKSISFGANETKKVSIYYDFPWFYKDETWSFGLRYSNQRVFEYITTTANTWFGGKVKDFEAVATLPKDVASRIELNPAGWKLDETGRAVLNKQNWSPSSEDNIAFSWRSDLAMHSKNGDNDCLDSKYYRDYHWRFGFDGSRRTAWCSNRKMLECKTFSIVPFNDDGEYDPQEISHAKSIDGEPVMVKGLKIINGYGKNDNVFANNARVRNIEFYMDDRIDREQDVKWKQAFRLKDTDQPQVVMFEEPIDIRKGLDFNIIDVYKGKRFEDICISEIQLIQ
ncbi:hypothetical protein HF888_05680 [Bermanella marisrubri]|uniref:NADase-type glycan-binding domain-containing protein n=1 Tax=Bermanella marisrubri TaxID=207949 RepID=UPI0010595018|nr:hypothetical protein [Bermanella marisrubri]QIZ83742.1 hypothetical protein HF888_05680 [Bermanella marisrubri]